jgi:hypothetical protein
LEYATSDGDMDSDEPTQCRRAIAGIATVTTCDAASFQGNAA